MNHEPDVMQLLADARPAYLEPTPDQNRRQADLRRALAEPGPMSGVTFFDAPRKLGRSRFQRNGARFAVGLTAAATVAAVTLVATGAVHGSPAPTAGGATITGHTGELGSSQILLLAASHVSTAATTGKYWRIADEYHSLELSGTKANPYTVDGGLRSELWAGRSNSVTSWSLEQQLPRVPATSADRAAWKAAGSPKKIDVHVLGKQGDVVLKDISTAASPAQVFAQDTSKAKVFYIGGIEKTMKQVQNLPADPAALKKALFENYQRSVDGYNAAGPADRGTGDGWTKDRWLFSTATDILTLPVSPSVRASAYRILAGLPHVQSLGQVKDVKGRAGNAVAIKWNSGYGLQQDRLIIDAKTGLLLAQETRLLKPSKSLSWVKPTDVYESDVVSQIGWTDDQPPAKTTPRPISPTAVG